MKKYILFIVLFCFAIAESQNLVSDFKINLDKNTSSFNILNPETNENVLFFLDKENIKCVKIDENLKMVEQLNVSKPEKHFKNIIGYKSENNTFSIYWENKSNQILEQKIDFNTKATISNSFELELEDEEVINRVTIGSKFYIVTILKKTSILNFYKFEDKITKTAISFEDKKFVNSINKPSNLWSLINEKRGSQKNYLFQNIISETPPSLVLSAEKRKCYVFGNKLIFSFDNSNSFTQTISIDLESQESNQIVFTKPYLFENDFNPIDSNSFFLEDKLIQIKLNYDKMLISVKTFDDVEIKSFEVNDNEEISFKNTDIIQENGSITNKRVLDKSNKLLRKINSSFPSVSFFSSNNEILMTLGGVSPVKNNNALYGGIIGGFTGAMIGALMTNYSIDNANSYSNRKVVYINCLFDKDFNHISREIEDNPFDKLRLFIHQNTHLQNQVVFKIDTNLFLGGYDQRNHKYKLFKF